MRDFFARTPEGEDSPVDLAQVRADDALIEALRQPLFDDPADAPARWLRSGDADTRSASDVTAALPAFGTAADYEDFLRPAADGADPRDADEVASDAQVAALLRAWKDEIDAVPLPPPLDTQIVASLVRSAPERRRSVRPMIAVAAAIAGLLMGSTAIGARSATPDDTVLWPVTQLLWGDRVEEIEASIEARKGIEEAAKAIDAGHPEAAEAALDHVTVVITRVEDSGEKATLQSDLNRVQMQLDSSLATSSAVPPVGTTSVEPGSPSPDPTSRSTSDPAPSAPVLPPFSEAVPTTSEVPVVPPVDPTTSSDPVEPPVDPVEPPVDPVEPPVETTPPDATTAETPPEAPTSPDPTPPSTSDEAGVGDPIVTDQEQAQDQEQVQDQDQDQEQVQEQEHGADVATPVVATTPAG